MTKICCDSFPKAGIIAKPHGKYSCVQCRKDVSLNVLKMFLTSPRETMALIKTRIK